MKNTDRVNDECDCDVEEDSDDERPFPTIQECEVFRDLVKLRLKDVEGGFVLFQSILEIFTEESTSKREVALRIRTLFGEHMDLLEGFKHFMPPSTHYILSDAVSATVHQEVITTSQHVWQSDSGDCDDGSESENESVLSNSDNSSVMNCAADDSEDDEVSSITSSVCQEVKQRVQKQSYVSSSVADIDHYASCEPTSVVEVSSLGEDMEIIDDLTSLTASRLLSEVVPVKWAPGVKNAAQIVSERDAAEQTHMNSVLDNAEVIRNASPPTHIETVPHNVIVRTTITQLAQCVAISDTKGGTGGSIMTRGGGLTCHELNALYDLMDEEEDMQSLSEIEQTRSPFIAQRSLPQPIWGSAIIADTQQSKPSKPRAPQAIFSSATKTQHNPWSDSSQSLPTFVTMKCPTPRNKRTSVGAPSVPTDNMNLWARMKTSTLLAMCPIEAATAITSSEPLSDSFDNASAASVLESMRTASVSPYPAPTPVFGSDAVTSARVSFKGRETSLVTGESIAVREAVLAHGVKGKQDYERYKILQNQYNNNSCTTKLKGEVDALLARYSEARKEGMGSFAGLYTAREIRGARNDK